MLEWIGTVADESEPKERGGASRSFQFGDFLSRRWRHIAIPFVLISVCGAIAAVVLPPTYVSQGKLLVEPQQVSTELVRTTVTSPAQDRLHVIQQRTMSGENILEIANKYQLFPEKRRSLTTDEFIDLIKKRTVMNPVDPALEFGSRSRPANPPVVFTIGFEYSDPVTAQKVAAELIERFIAEDVRDRKERAATTTKFVAEEYQRRKLENAALDAKVAELRAKLRDAAVDQTRERDQSPLTQLKEEYAQKSALYSESHPILKSIAQQIRSLESTKAREKATSSEELARLDALTAQQDASRKILEQVEAKISAATAGENLEKNQQSEKLEVLEPATLPERATKPNRPKILATAIVLAFLAGLALAYLAEMMDSTVRSTGDLSRIIDEQMALSIPYISNGAETWRKNGMRVGVAGILVAVVVIAAIYGPKFQPQMKAMIGEIETNISK